RASFRDIRARQILLPASAANEIPKGFYGVHQSPFGNAISTIVKPSASTTFLRVTYPTCGWPLRIFETVIIPTPAFAASLSLLSRWAPIAALITSILYGA